MRLRVSAARSLLLICFAIGAGGSGVGQEPAKPVAGGGFTVGVDAVMTDSNNHIVKNIRAEDLEIWEDGVLQTIDARRFLDGSRKEAEPRA